jgi:hypothetical protein
MNGTQWTHRADLDQSESKTRDCATPLASPRCQTWHNHCSPPIRTFATVIPKAVHPGGVKSVSIPVAPYLIRTLPDCFTSRHRLGCNQGKISISGDLKHPRCVRVRLYCMIQDVSAATVLYRKSVDGSALISGGRSRHRVLTRVLNGKLFFVVGVDV